MDRETFEGRARAQGFGEIVNRDMPANSVNTMHRHDFDAQILVVAGEMAMRREDGERLFRIGEICEVQAGTLHEECAGPQGATYIAARRRQPVVA